MVTQGYRTGKRPLPGLSVPDKVGYGLQNLAQGLADVSGGLEVPIFRQLLQGRTDLLIGAFLFGLIDQVLLFRRLLHPFQMLLHAHRIDSHLDLLMN